MNLKSVTDQIARTIIATALKKICAKTSVISEQNDILSNWKTLLVNSNHKPTSSANMEFLFSLIEESNIAINTFSDDQSKQIEDSLTSEVSRSDIAYNLRHAIEYNVSCVLARRCISTIKKILAVGATVGLLYAAYKIITSGESGESAISRAKEKEKEIEAKLAAKQIASSKGTL